MQVSPKIMRRLAKPMLFSAAFIWGSSFFVMKNALEAIPTFYLLASRFCCGALILAVVCIFMKKWTHFTKDYFWRGAILGALLFTAYAVQTFGLLGTTPSKNAFLTTVYCVLVPFFNWLVMKVRPDRFNILSAFLCVTGVGLVSLTENFTITWGDWLTLMCAIFYAFNMVAVAKLSPGKDIYLLTVFQFIFTGLYSLLGALLFESFPVAAFKRVDVLLPMIYLCVMATVVALLFQNVGQVWSDPASASLILSLESVFGVICSVIFYGDEITVRLLFGFAFIFAAIVCSETKLSFLKKSKTSSVDDPALSSSGE